MNEQIKKKWVKALRSGKYQQTTGNYYHGGAYCCLGVLLKITRGRASGGYDMKRFDRDFGLSLDDADDLAALNDSGATFDQIAYCIENGL